MEDGFARPVKREPEQVSTPGDERTVGRAPTIVHEEPVPSSGGGVPTPEHSSPGATELLW